MLLSMCVKAETIMETAAYVHGYWTNWQQRYSNGMFAVNDLNFVANVNTYSRVFTGMEFRRLFCDKWDWCFKFEIDNYRRPDKKERKMHEKSNQWYEYSGWVEYYVTDDYPTIEKVLEKYKFPLIEPKGDSARAKRRARATIKIAPYKKEPTCFNIYFDAVGVAISFNKWPFDKSHVIQ